MAYTCLQGADHSDRHWCSKGHRDRFQINLRSYDEPIWKIFGDAHDHAVRVVTPHNAVHSALYLSVHVLPLGWSQGEGGVGGLGGRTAFRVCGAAEAKGLSMWH